MIIKKQLVVILWISSLIQYCRNELGELEKGKIFNSLRLEDIKKS